MIDDLKYKIIRTDTLKRPYRISDEDWDFCKDIKINICAKDSMCRNGRQRLGLSAFFKKRYLLMKRVETIYYIMS